MTSAQRRRVSKTRLSAALLIEPLRPDSPVAEPSTVLTMFTRSQGVAGAAYSSASSSSPTSPGASPGRPGPVRCDQDSHVHLITQYCTPNGSSA